MIRYLLTLIIIGAGFCAKAQNFPDAQKQPRMKESRGQHKKFVRQGVRHHYHGTPTKGKRAEMHPWVNPLYLRPKDLMA